MKNKIIISSEDYFRLQEIADGAYPMDRDILRMLMRKLESATVLEPAEIPEQVVTMNSRVHLLDQNTDSITVWRLVYPEEAAPDSGKLSVLSPLGIAILGVRVGDRAEWPISSVWARISILKIAYQPESRMRKEARA